MSSRNASFELHQDNTQVFSNFRCLATELLIAARSDSIPDQFIRSIDVYPPRLSLKSLKRLVTTTDRELQKCADMCDAEVIPHTWGLISTFYSQLPWKRYANLSLVARVDYIDGAIIPNDLDPAGDTVPVNIQEQVHEGVARYNHPLRRLSRRHLYDMRPSQFMYGRNVNNPDQIDPAIFLVDIEPVYRIKQGGGL